MNDRINYKILTFVRYLGDSFFYPFFALYINSKDNIGESKIGILISITPFIGLIANPIFSKICKNFKILKTVLGIISILEALLIGLIVNFDTFTPLLICTILLAIFGSSHYGLFDSLLTIYATENKINFSSLRIFGSISYIFGTAIGGVLIDKVSYASSFYICVGYFIMSGLMYMFLKPIYNEIKKEEKRNYSEVLKNKKFICFMIYYMLLYGVLKTNNNFYSLLLDSRNESSTIFGFNYFIFVGVEILVLFLLTKFDVKTNYRKLFLAASISLVLMMFINGSSLPNVFIIIFSALRGITWGIVLFATNKVVVNLLGVKNATLGTMALDLSYSIVTIICGIVGGFIIEQFGYQVFYMILGFIALLDTFFYINVVRKYVVINDNLTKNEAISE